MVSEEFLPGIKTCNDDTVKILQDLLRMILVDLKYTVDLFAPALLKCESSKYEAVQRCLNVLKTQRNNYIDGLVELANVTQRVCGNKEDTSDLDNFVSFHKKVTEASDDEILVWGRLTITDYFSKTFGGATVENQFHGQISGKPIQGDVFKRGQVVQRKKEDQVSPKVMMPAAEGLSFMNKKRQPIGKPKIYADALEYYSKFWKDEFPVSDYPSKIEVSFGGRYIYYAGETLGVAEIVEGEYTDLGAIYALQSCTLKALPNGDLLINDFSSWDLILMDYNFKEKGRVPGQGKGAPSFFKSICTRSSADSRYLLWISGPRDISAIDLTTMAVQTISDFWVVAGKIASDPIAVIALENCNSIIGIGEQQDRQTLHFSDAEGFTTTYELSKLLTLGNQS